MAFRNYSEDPTLTKNVRAVLGQSENRQGLHSHYSWHFYLLKRNIYCKCLPTEKSTEANRDTQRITPPKKLKLKQTNEENVQRS